MVSCDATTILQTLRKDLPLQLGRLIQIVKQQLIYAANNALAQHTHTQLYNDLSRALQHSISTAAVTYPLMVNY